MAQANKRIQETFIRPGRSDRQMMVKIARGGYTPDLYDVPGAHRFYPAGSISECSWRTRYTDDICTIRILQSWSQQ